MQDKMVIRQSYIDWLERYRDEFTIAKIITGPRRCGKSTLMLQYIGHLIETGVREDEIIVIDFDDPRYQGITSNLELNSVLNGLLPESRCYIFFDELQEVESWERTVAGLCNRGNVDVYITGSNGHLASSEFSTHITGRFTEIPMLPLSFHEYFAMYARTIGQSSILMRYLADGGIPFVSPMNDPRLNKEYLTTLLEAIISLDVASRKSTPNVPMARKLAVFLYSNIGNETSTLGISKSVGMNSITVEKYLDALVKSGLFHYVDKYDVVGAKHLNTNGKYYATDLGIRNCRINGYELLDASRPLENLVFLELVRRGYTISTGNYNGREINFVAERNGDREYFQVCLTMHAEDMLEREIRSYNNMKDSFKKTILTADKTWSGGIDGVRIINIEEWLLDDGVDPRIVGAPSTWRISDFRKLYGNDINEG